MVQKPVVLLILDGWGYREKITDDNAIKQGNTPNWHNLLKTYPNSLIETSGNDVGLPKGQMGNSEVGHMNIGAGRVVMQDLPRIDRAVEEKEFEKTATMQALIKSLKASGKACHIMGLISPGGVHSVIPHTLAACEVLSRNGIKVWMHAFTDGRDTPPQSALGYIADFQKELDKIGVKIASVSGRYYAMDRDKRWERVEQAYNAIVSAEGKRFATAVEAIEASYAEGVNDEFIVPVIIGEYKGAEENDSFMMTNYRTDRAREITYALGDEKFDGFARKKTVKFDQRVMMTEYSSDHNRFMKPVFPSQTLSRIYGEIVAEKGLTQLRIAETEKYAHVTFFFNGGEEKLFAGEERILVPSPKVATYDLQPEMSLPEVTDKLIDAIENKRFDTIICNFANGDMVGHTGIMDAALKAVEAVDNSLGRVVEAIKKVDGVLLVTADHGNIEKMVDENGAPYTAHTIGKVEAVLVNAKTEVKSLRDGCLADLSPTLLELLEIEQPKEMTGKSLIVKG